MRVIIKFMNNKVFIYDRIEYIYLLFHESTNPDISQPYACPIFAQSFPQIISKRNLLPRFSRKSSTSPRNTREELNPFHWPIKAFGDRMRRKRERERENRREKMPFIKRYYTMARYDRQRRILILYTCHKHNQRDYLRMHGRLT